MLHFMTPHLGKQFLGLTFADIISRISTLESTIDHQIHLIQSIEPGYESQRNSTLQSIFVTCSINSCNMQLLRPNTTPASCSALAKDMMYSKSNGFSGKPKTY